MGTNPISDVPEFVVGTLRQPSPRQTEGGVQKDVLPLVIEDLKARSENGIKSYGVPLRTCNGRSALIDAYQEALDLAMYLRQLIEETTVPNNSDPSPNGTIK